jgi:hypothetical protein
MFGSRDAFVNRFNKGELSLRDFTPEHRIKMKSGEIAALADPKKRKALVPPAPGYSVVGQAWHRSGSALVHDNKSDTSYLFGQDEGTYFGVELPSPCYTIANAYKILIPEEARGVGFIRQGEWFAVQVDAPPELPDTTLLVSKVNNANGVENIDLYLPLDTPESNKHTLMDVEEIRVGKDGQMYVRGGYLDHDQHAAIQFQPEDQWYTFYKNTAVRSVSQEGVD